jgi:hypothetical protein
MTIDHTSDGSECEHSQHHDLRASILDFARMRRLKSQLVTEINREL